MKDPAYYFPALLETWTTIGEPVKLYGNPVIIHLPIKDELTDSYSYDTRRFYLEEFGPYGNYHYQYIERLTEYED
jgi:hypothetical protein